MNGSRNVGQEDAIHHHARPLKDVLWQRRRVRQNVTCLLIGYTISTQVQRLAHTVGRRAQPRPKEAGRIWPTWRPGANAGTTRLAIQYDKNRHDKGLGEVEDDPAAPQAPVRLQPVGHPVEHWVEDGAQEVHTWRSSGDQYGRGPARAGAGRRPEGTIPLSHPGAVGKPKPRRRGADEA